MITVMGFRHFGW